MSASSIRTICLRIAILLNLLLTKSAAKTGGDCAIVTWLFFAVLKFVLTHSQQRLLYFVFCFYFWCESLNLRPPIVCLQSCMYIVCLALDRVLAAGV